MKKSQREDPILKMQYYTYIHCGLGVEISIREKAFCEMKKRCRDQKSKETRRMEMGSIFKECQHCRTYSHSDNNNNREPRTQARFFRGAVEKSEGPAWYKLHAHALHPGFGHVRYIQIVINITSS